MRSGAALHVSGPGSGDPLLFLHGVGGGAWSWRGQHGAFATAYRTYVWEARGHGAAAPVTDAGLADYYADAREALAAVVSESGRAPVIVGHSMGGLLAIALAADDGANVRGLFLIDPVYSDGTSDYGHFSPKMGKIALSLCSPLLHSFERNGPVSRTLARWMFGASFEHKDRMAAAWPDQRRQVPIEYPRMLRESFGIPTGFELRDFASDIDVPVYLLEGSAGMRRPRFAALTAILERRLGTSFVREAIPGGHYLQADDPDAVNERLKRFLTTLTT